MVIMRSLLCTLIAVLALGLMGSAQAQESVATNELSYRYGPEYCEFEARFPSEPYITQRCDHEDGDQCFDHVSFTQVFGLDSTINFRIICNPVESSVISDYSGEVMAATLRAMSKQTHVDVQNTAYREAASYKQAGLVGEGLSGNTQMIYIAQLWIGQKSAMTVEAELIGDALSEADQLFSDILRSVRPIAEVPKAVEKQETKTESTQEPQAKTSGKVD